MRGREHNYLLRQSALHASDGELLGLLILFHDLTHLRDKERARTNLIASLSHELNTPLTALSLAVGLLNRTAQDTKQREIVDTLVEEVSRIRDLSEGLVSAVRGETAAIAVRSINLDLGAMAASVVKRFLLSAGQKAIRLKIQTEHGLLCYGDPVKLSWVLATLIDNALWCTPEGGEQRLCLPRCQPPSASGLRHGPRHAAGHCRHHFRPRYSMDAREFRKRRRSTRVGDRKRNRRGSWRPNNRRGLRARKCLHNRPSSRLKALPCRNC